MKTKEEIENLKSKVNTVNQKLAAHDDAVKKDAIILDKELVELSEEDLSKVTAGTAFTAGTYSFSYFIHDNCGGMIHNVGNPFACCYCDKCGETHYWHFSFDYTEIFEE